MFGLFGMACSDCSSIFENIAVCVVRSFGVRWNQLEYFNSYFARLIARSSLVVIICIFDPNFESVLRRVKKVIIFRVQKCFDG